MTNDWGGGEPRPWEQPGAHRRDLPPHRAELLKFLATASVVCGLLSFILLAPVLVGLPCGVVGWVLAGLDLRRMRAGDLDGSGERETRHAFERAGFGVALCFHAPFVFCGLAILAVWFLGFLSR